MENNLAGIVNLLATMYKISNNKRLSYGLCGSAVFATSKKGHVNRTLLRWFNICLLEFCHSGTITIRLTGPVSFDSIKFARCVERSNTHTHIIFGELPNASDTMQEMPMQLREYHGRNGISIVLSFNHSQ